jgi:hypothetical protein
LLSLDPKVVKEHIDLKKLKKYLSLCVEEVSANSLKAAVLKKIFRKKLWDEFFQCPELKHAVEVTINLIYFSGSDEEKGALLAKLKEHLTNIKAVAETQSAEQPLKKYCNINGMLSVVNRAGEKNIRFFDLMNCFNFDQLIDALIPALNLPQDNLSKIVKLPILKQLLRDYQAGKLLTPDDLKAVLNLKQTKSAAVPTHIQLLALGTNGITADMVNQWLDFPWLCEQLNNLRDGKPFDLKGLKQRLKVINDFTGLDIVGAFNSDLPAEVQLGKVEDLVNTVNDPTAWNVLKKLQYGLPFLGLPVVLYLAGVTLGDAACSLLPSIFTPVMAVADSLKCWYITGPLTAITTYALVKATQASSAFFETPSRTKYMAVNAAVSIAATRVIRGTSAAVHPHLVTVNSIRKDIPEGHKLHIFCDRITDEHIQQLPSPEALLHLISDPLGFMMAKEHENFLLGLLSIDAEEASARVKALLAALNDSLSKNNLTTTAMPHYTAFMLFKNFCGLCQRQPLSKLAQPQILELALFNPRLLLTQSTFIRTLHGSIAGGKSLFLQLWTAIEKADMLQKK